MITTVTTTTTTVATATTSAITSTTGTISMAVSLSIIGTIVLILLLIVKELLFSHRPEKTLFLSNRLNIAIVPLLLMFFFVVSTKIAETFGF